MLQLRHRADSPKKRCRRQHEFNNFEPPNFAELGNNRLLVRKEEKDAGSFRSRGINSPSHRRWPFAARKWCSNGRSSPGTGYQEMRRSVHTIEIKPDVGLRLQRRFPFCLQRLSHALRNVRHARIPPHVRHNRKWLAGTRIMQRLKVNMPLAHHSPG